MMSKLLTFIATGLWLCVMFSTYSASAVPAGLVARDLDTPPQLTVGNYLEDRSSAQFPTCSVDLYIKKVLLYVRKLGHAGWVIHDNNEPDKDDDGTLKAGECYRPAELQSSFKQQAFWSQNMGMSVEGYCSCTVYQDNDCGEGVDTKDLKASALRNRIKSTAGAIGGSFKCSLDNGWANLGANRCQVWASNEAKDGEPSRVLKKEFQQGDIDSKSGQSECIPINIEQEAGFIMRGWNITDCTCHFYTDDGCKSRFITDGMAGTRVVSGFQFGNHQKIMSFRCDLPWKINPDEVHAAYGSNVDRALDHLLGTGFGYVMPYVHRVPGYEIKPNDQLYSKRML
ncbi:hypothetical protein TWF506_002475 [Arthrobotrys conoides]|uniref:Ecp2 effector protein domain-containing protein n=1 Tax=Arthrobotrys conoides TaxID=74498 RepID=A0AAN8MZV6_9PEZI